MTGPLDEGAIPSTSTYSSANWLFDKEEFEVESYIYKDSKLILVKDGSEDSAVRKGCKNMLTKKMIAVGVFALVMANVPMNGVCAVTELSKERIIEIAKAKASAWKFKVETMTITYDDGNLELKKFLMREGVSQYDKQTGKWIPVEGTTPERWRPKLASRDFQAVYFAPKQQMKGGDFWVFVDRNTGEVIDVVGGK
ncbi:MAG TPA: hypothetical protein PLL75_07810 [Candidatus Omnitrophota bacterium]|nr:hypothetical protein [Candidatus Omnitrophota bacterium]HPS37612.1 hypothetical protein [Candidatus Omnitrophota bacterium]